MIRGEPANRFEHLLDVVVSWPGITVDQAALEVGVVRSSLQSYVAACRHAGWLRRGAVPLTMDTGLATIADWRAADGMASRLDRDVYRVVCSRYDLHLPCNIRDLVGDRFSYGTVNDGFVRLRAAGVVRPIKTLWATEAGEILASARLDMHPQPFRSAG